VDNNNIERNIKHEGIFLTNTIIEQNYFQFESGCYKQNDGLAMGAPTSAILSEIYLQYIERTYIRQILQKHNIHN
jgi:hypothetical protein